MWSIIRRELYYRRTFRQLQKRGLKVGTDVWVAPFVVFDTTYPFLIEVHDHCRISAGTLILSHDATTFRQLGATRLGRVRILEGTFIGSNCIILPGCTIGPHAMVAAGSVVNRDIPEGYLAAGNPARPYGKLSDLLARHQAMMAESPIFDYEGFVRRTVAPRDIQAALDRHPVAFMRGLKRTKPLIERVLSWGRA